MDDWEAGMSGAAAEDFDVFLNHRGPDVKATFVSHLEDALRCAGFRPFLDARALVKGSPALASIEQALAMAKVHVAVVSPGYAQSKYCLDELVAMLRSGKPVVPVFYGVEPVDLRWLEQGPFAAAFEGHKAKRTEKRVGEWREALGKLAAITGFRLADYRSNEARLKREVVKQVVCFIPSNDPIEVEECRVGLESRTNECVEKVESMGAGVGILGLVGMGGVGKTTLAREIYNRFVAMNKFAYMTFLEMHQVRSSSLNVEVRPTESKKLRKQLLWDLLRVQSDGSNYKSWFAKVSSLGPVFIAMDDVHKLDEFQELIPFASLLHQGSQILITSRDGSILKCVGGVAKVDLELYDVSRLAWNESNELFNRHAFHDYEAWDAFKGVAKDVVKACAGLPLALKAIGSSLYDKKSDEDRKTIWVEAVDALRQREDVMGVLRWSYDFLSDEEKRMFLDITCMFHNESVLKALAYWRSCVSSGGVKTPHTSMKSLMDKNLIKEDSWGQFEVHDLLLDLGLEIGREAKSHLICNDIDDGIALAKKGMEETRVLNLAKSRKRKFDASMFSNMPNLHHLILPYKSIVNGDLRCIPEELRRLQWRGAPFGCIPTRLSLIHLLELDFSYSTNLVRLWTEANGCFEGCLNLRLLNLKNCTSITKLPNSIGQLEALESLNISGCTSLKAIPDSLGLSNLTSLWANSCHDLLELPTSIGQSSQLQWLNLEDCNSLEKLPKSIEQLHALKSLSLSYCTSLKALPNTIGGLSNLEDLSAFRCTSLVKIPKSIGQLHALKSLELSQCKSLKALPNTIGGLSNLEGLWARGCNSLVKIPKSIGQLHALKSLWLDECTSLKALPNTIGGLSNLEDLSARGCNSLVKIPKSIGQLHALKSLKLSECTSLKALPNTIGGLSNLKGLWATSCSSLVKIPKSIGQLHALKSLQLYECTSLKALPNTIGGLSNLEGLWATSCSSLVKIPKSIGQLHALKSLALNQCTSLKALPNTISGLSNLESLWATGCSSLVKVPYSSIGLLRNLQTLCMGPGTECPDFADGNIVTTWTRLVNLDLCNCGELGSRLQYGALKSLRDLQLSERTLTELPESLGLLVHLEKLRIYDCERLQIERFPQSFGDLKMLKCLDLINCKSLRRLPKDWRALTHLQRLSIKCCPIRRLPTSIRQLKRLQEFKVRGCGSIEAMGALTTLQGVPIWGSTSLTHLPASLRMASHLYISSYDWKDSGLFDVTNYDVLEEDESGYLRANRDTISGETTLIRWYREESIRLTDLATNSGSDESTSGLNFTQ